MTVIISNQFICFSNFKFFFCVCLQYAYQEEQERPLHAPTTQCCKLAPLCFLSLASIPTPSAPSSSCPPPLVTRTHGKNSEIRHVAEMRLMDEATHGGSESQCDKPCDLARVNTGVTCSEGDSCVTDARRHAAVDRLAPLSV